MTQEEIEIQCRAVCPNAVPGKCAFSRGELSGFIDMSSRLDGSRGIAFYPDSMAVNTDGSVRMISYENIRSAVIVESFENSFADELILSGKEPGGGFEIRFSDYSLDKSALKRLIDGLRGVSDITETREEAAREADQEAAREVKPGEMADIFEIADHFRENQPSEISDVFEIADSFQDGFENDPVFSGVVTELREETVREDQPENQPIKAEAAEIVGDVREEPPIAAEVVEIVEDLREDQPIAVEAVETVEDPREDQPSEAEAVEIVENPREDQPSEAEVFEVVNDVTESQPTESEAAEIVGDVREEQPIAAEAVEVVGDVREEQPIAAEAAEIVEDPREDQPSEAEVFEVVNDVTESQPIESEAAEVFDTVYDYGFPNVIPEEKWEDPKTEYTEFTEFAQFARTITQTAEENPTFSFKIVRSDDFDDDFDEQAELERISAMSHEQTISYLADAFSEMNGISDNNKYDDDFYYEEPDEEAVPDNFIVEEAEAPDPEADKERLTVEPAWGDIYIKASRSLRELCEQGKLSMEAIREELRIRLLPVAEVFADLTADESKIPKVLMPMITELRNAADNFDEYFSYGEDIGTRAMFFMLFQMLSYSDRIVEDSEVKKRHNDFFKRFGAAGIILSMLDKRV